MLVTLSQDLCFLEEVALDLYVQKNTLIYEILRSQYGVGKRSIWKFILDLKYYKRVVFRELISRSKGGEPIIGVVHAYLIRSRFRPLEYIAASIKRSQTELSLSIVPEKLLKNTAWYPLLRKFYACTTVNDFDIAFTDSDKLLLFNRFLQWNDPPSKRGRLFSSYSELGATRVGLYLAGLTNNRPNNIELAHRYYLWLQLCFHELDCANLRPLSVVPQRIDIEEMFSTLGVDTNVIMEPSQEKKPPLPPRPKRPG